MYFVSRKIISKIGTKIEIKNSFKLLPSKIRYHSFDPNQIIMKTTILSNVMKFCKSLFAIFSFLRLLMVTPFACVFNLVCKLGANLFSNKVQIGELIPRKFATWSENW